MVTAVFPCHAKTKKASTVVVKRTVRTYAADISFVRCRTTMLSRLCLLALQCIAHLTYLTQQHLVFANVKMCLFAYRAGIEITSGHSKRMWRCIVTPGVNGHT